MSRVAGRRGAVKPATGTVRWLLDWDWCRERLAAGLSVPLRITVGTQAGLVAKTYWLRRVANSYALEVDSLGPDYVRYELPTALDCCSCPDHQTRGRRCKHMAALAAALARLSAGSPSPSTPTTVG